MLINYLKTAWRNLSKNRLYTIINIIGLAIGLSCFVLVLSYNRKELSYDKEFAAADRIFRINTSLDINGVPTHYPMAHFPAGQDMVDEFPGVTNTVRMYRPNLFGGNIPKVKNGDIIFPEEAFYFTDSTFFQMFDMPFKYGDRATALNNPFSVVLTEAMANKYFGSIDPVGKELLYNDSTAFKVTGVVRQLDFNTHLKFDFVANARAMIRQSISPNIDLENSYMGLWYFSYIQLDKKTDVDALRKMLPDFVQRHFTDRYKDNNAYLELQNVRDIHLQSANMAAGQMSPPGNLEYVFVLSMVGISVLVVACFNFVNMATSRYLARTKEVGIRKAIGAERVQLIVQFISEASLITLLAGITGLGLVALSLPMFNQLASANLAFDDIFTIADATRFLILFISVGVLSGMYPAFVLSSLKPAMVLKGVTGGLPSSKLSVRRVLVILQFAVSMILVIGTFVVLSQVEFLQNRDMGFSREKVLVIRDPGVAIFQQYAAFKNELIRSGVVDHVTHLSHDMGQETLPFYPFRREGKDEEMMLPSLSAGFDFLETFGLTMVQGRYFDINAPGDSTFAFVINESAARQFGWNDAVNRHLTFGVNPNPKHHIIGVVKDFNFDPLRTAVGPLVIKFSVAFGQVAVKLKAGETNDQVNAVEQVWKAVYPGVPFNYYFLDEGINNAYREEQKLAKIYSSFCVVAIFIASLGLFALASYTIERRKKEMAVRKVLGSSSFRITLLIYKEFLVLIGIAFLIASPAALYVFGSWLNQFAYHIDIEAWIFILALAMVSFIAATTILYQAVRAGQLSPSRVLKSD